MTNSPPWPSAGTWSACGAAVIGAEGHMVQADANVSDDAAPFSLTGLPETSVRETRDRVRAAVLNSGLPWPDRGVTVTLQPPGLPKHGTGLDLAIAVAVLTGTGAVAKVPEGCLFYGELGLDGTLRPLRGVIPAVLAAVRAGRTQGVVPDQNAAEAAMLPGVTVIPCPSLRAVVSWLRGDPLPVQPGIDPAAASPPDICPEISLARLTVPPPMRLAFEASAAGGHHLCLTGPSGAQLPALAASVAALMPPLQREETLETAATHSAAGLLGPRHALITRPRFRAPHHTTTPAGMAGGGSGVMRPGEAALAHRGVLFLDDAPKFTRSVLGCCGSLCRTVRSPWPGPVTQCGSRRSSPSSPGCRRARAAPSPAPPVVLWQHAATAGGSSANWGATSQYGSTFPRPGPSRPDPGSRPGTRTPSQRPTSRPPVTGPAVG